MGILESWRSRATSALFKYRGRESQHDRVEEAIKDVVMTLNLRYELKLRARYGCRCHQGVVLQRKLDQIQLYNSDERSYLLKIRALSELKARPPGNLMVLKKAEQASGC